jgi:sigma-B regulation protein RsbU (phosphoserine phosphatase)
MSSDERVAQLEKKLQQLNSAIEELTVLNDLAIAASTTIDVDQMLDTIVQKSIKAVKAEQGKILLVTQQQDAPLQTLIRQDNMSGGMAAFSVGTHITGWVLKNQQALLIENLATDERFRASEQERQSIRTVLCVPIWYRAKIIGVLTVNNKKTNQPFSANDSRLLSIIAAQSGQLIRNSQLQEEAIQKKRMEQELALAREIQMSLIPQKDPDLKKLEINSYFSPADEVGGDYYDYFYLDENQFGVVLADISGHGASAALIMTMVKGILHSITHQFRSPVNVLSEINSVLSHIAPKEMFATMVFLVFDFEKNILRFSNAGHPPIIYYNNQQSRCEIESPKGCALNLTTKHTFSDKEIPFQPNDTFIIYTDGVTEAINDSFEMFGEKRLIKAIEESVSDPSEKVLDNIKNQLGNFASVGAQSDDIALITIKIK